MDGRKISVRTARLNNLVLGRSDCYGLQKDQPDEDGDGSLEVAICREGLLDSLFVLYEECSKDALTKKDKNVADFVNKYRPIIKETRSMRVNVADFDVKNMIGKGYFGEVHLVTERQTGEIYAMKKMRKAMVTSTQVREERDIMASRRSDWITSLQYAFQDQECLYLVMEYLPGGDLLSLMIRIGVFDEELAQFYLSELTEALHSLHELGYVHRDIKPENILLDRFGHLKLADFGNAITMNKDGSVTSMTPVGTPDYIAPELLQTLSISSKSTNRNHDVTCDFWSMGIIGYEFVTEATPFHDENVNEIYSKIIAHCEGRYAKKLEYPEHVSVSTHYRDLIDRLVTKASNRMGYPEIKRHPFFSDVNWDKLRYRISPIIPTVSSDDDTSNFEDVDKSIKRNPYANKPTFPISKVNDFSGQNLPFLGYSYVYEEPDLAGMYRDTDEHMVTARLSQKIKEQNRVLKEHVSEIHQLQRELLEKERKVVTASAHSKIFAETKKELENLQELLKVKTAELAAAKTDIKTLRNRLKIEEEQRLKNDATIADLLKQTYKKWEKAKQSSDQNYEKQIADRRTEISTLNEKLRSQTNDLRSKIDECSQLQTMVENYKELLKKSKDQLMLDKEEYDKNHQQLVLTYEGKILELKQKWKAEKEARGKQEEENRELRSRLQDNEHTVKSAEHTHQKFVDNMKRRMTIQLEEAKQVSDKMSEEMQRKCEDLRREIFKLQEQSVSSSATSSNRSSLLSTHDQEFKSANSSLQELHVQLEVQLRNDLIKARESEDLQRKRADGLEEVVSRLEKIIDQFKTNGCGAVAGASGLGVGSDGSTLLLERQNERLEDKLSAIREQSIIDKQSARTANLSLWKLEKELERVKLDNSILQRRVEQAEERVNKARLEKEEVEFKSKQATEVLGGKEKHIDDLKEDIRQLKDELKKEKTARDYIDKGRLAEKAELITCSAKIQSLEEKLEEVKQTASQTNDKLRMMTSENSRLLRELKECQEELADVHETNKELEAKMASISRNFNMLKGACSITETQLTELEILLEKEKKSGKESLEKITYLQKQLKEKDSDITKFRQELHQERSSKTLSESRTAQLVSEYEELRKKFEDLQTQMVDQQKELIEKTTSLFEVQERIEMLNLDTSNLQKVVSNYEHEHLILKEENAKILTDLFLAKEHITKQNNDAKDYKNHINQLNAELDHVKSVLAEQKLFYSERDIKSEATLAQHKKLIDYLQARVEESTHKKKKTFAEKVFGTSGNDKKENVPPNPIMVENTTSYKKLQDELQKERQRTNQLKEQLLRAKTDMIAMQGTLKKAQKDEDNNQHQIDNPEITHLPEKTSSKTKHPEPHSSKKRSPVKTTTASRAHTFDMTLETPSSKNPVQLCSVCDRHILAGQAYWKCKDCSKNVHRKCRSGAPNNCRRASALSGGLNSLANELTEDGSTASLDAVSIADRPFDSSDDHPVSSIGEKTDNDEDEGDKYVGDLLFKTRPLEPRLIINDVYDVNEYIVLLACENGLFSYNTETTELVHIKGIPNVKSFTISQHVPKAIIIGNDGEYLYQCDTRHLQSRAQASSCLSPKLETFVLDLSIANRTHTERWHLVEMMDEVPSHQMSEVIAIAATSSRIVILKFDTTLGRFKPVRGLDTVVPVPNILFTKHTAIVSSDKFFEIDLTTFGAEEFLDMSDTSLRDIRSCTPMASFKINSQEILLCFKEVGIFVDEYGCRSRPHNINWLQEPLDFKYRESCLFIAHSDCVQVMYISKSYTKELERQETADERRAFVNLNSPPRLMAFVDFARTCIYVACECGSSKEREIIKLDGYKALQTTCPGISKSMETLSSLASYPTTVGQSNETLADLAQAV
ncbi:citron Rho-interacting kinase [Uranotaenia lowii]|uniref:citron Rho-interacting kinase n=1 Tax=Uranotaenia lowii TaxID=190385 RepID=UPI0024798AB0|nr:citron Rho-interacting kinase [Uranotaenia lowii]